MSAKAAPLTVVQPDQEVEAGTRPLDFGLIRRMFVYTRPYALIRNSLLVIVVLRAAQLATAALLVGLIIDDVATTGDLDRLWWWALAYAGLALFTAITFAFRSRLALELGEGVVHDLRRDLFRQLQRMPMRFYNTTKLGRIISRMVSDVEAVRVGVQDVLFVSMVQGIQMLLAGIFMAVQSLELFLVVVFMTPVLWAINRFFRGRFAETFRAIQESFSRVTSTLAESVNGIRVTQGFGREDENARMFSELVADHSTYNLRGARLKGTFIPLLDLTSQLFLAMMLIIGGWLVLGGEAEIGVLVTFFFLANLFFAPVQNIGNQYTQALTAMAGAERVFALLDREPEWEDPPDAERPSEIRGEVEFEDLAFAYRPGEPVLEDINFRVEPGQTVALVGHTGSGKSTIVNLLAKFYLPTSGGLRIDGVDIRRLASEALHKRLGIVLQANFLFSGSVLDNIRMGREGATEAEAIEVLDRLDCRDLLEALPQGLYTTVGEGGGSLSLGQRQLVCFARAMIADPAIMILDEATSAVDTMTEVRIQSALKVLLAGRTSFVVAHRLSTIRGADLVLVLDQGRIVERGSHHELLESGGRYADLYREFIKTTE